MNTATVNTFIKSPTGRLTATYLAIIMLMSIGFSVVFYHTSVKQLGRQLPPQSIYDTLIERRVNGRGQVDIFLHDRIDEARAVLMANLIMLNLAALGLGGLISYYLARRTLRPIEEAVDAQNRFVSDASHELRTPITAIQTTNEVALRKQKLSIGEAKDLISYNIEEIVKLKNLTDGLLSLLKQDQQPIAQTIVSVQDLLAESINHVMHSALQKKITIEDTIPHVKVLGNGSMLEQAITILLDNAIKYSPEKTTISLKAHTKGKSVYIEVHDQGVGIKASDLPHIFDRFYRADTSRSKVANEGYGLGLSIAKKIIDQHNGEIKANSTPGKGTTFILKLPFDAKQHKQGVIHEEK